MCVIHQGKGRRRSLLDGDTCLSEQVTENLYRATSIIVELLPRDSLVDCPWAGPEDLGVKTSNDYGNRQQSKSRVC